MLLSDNLGMIKADNGFIFRCILMATNLFHRIFSIMSASLLVVCLLTVPQAWAYKTEKICENIPATSSVPAHKKCKVVSKRAALPNLVTAKLLMAKRLQRLPKNKAQPAAGYFACRAHASRMTPNHLGFRGTSCQHQSKTRLSAFTLPLKLSLW